LTCKEKAPQLIEGPNADRQDTETDYRTHLYEEISLHHQIRKEGRSITELQAQSSPQKIETIFMNKMPKVIYNK